MEKWHGFECKEFEFEGRRAILVFPRESEVGKNWTLKTEYWDAFPETELALLDSGFHAAYLENTSRLAPEEDCHAKARFVQFLSREYGLRDKCVPVGFSCGGAHAVNFAGFHPECIACMFIDAPVLNFCDFPGRIGKFEEIWQNEFEKTYPGVTRAGLLNFANHPMNKLPVLRQHRIPIIMMYGTDDDVVVYDFNGRLMELDYEACPDLLRVIPRIGQGHHPHGVPDNPQEVADFIISHCCG